MICLIALLGLVQAGATQEPMVAGHVRLSDGLPVAGAQVALFDVTDLAAGVVAHATTDGAGYFALPLRGARGSALPHGFTLGPNYPNPFNPSTIIPYQLPVATHVRLEVFNLLGQRVATLVEGERAAGFHTAMWDATNAAGQAVGAGVYLYRLSGDGVSLTRRMVLIDGQAGVPVAGAGLGHWEPAAVEGPREADTHIYGLTVSGPGVIAYVDPAFQVGADMAPVDLVVEAVDGRPLMKVATSGVLGDVNNDDYVDLSDALLVVMYVIDSSVTAPNNGDLSLGDVNGDGRIDLSDALLIMTYSVNPSDPGLPAGIGRREAVNGGTPTKMYWAHKGSARIQRANLNGSQIEDLITWGVGEADIALDVVGGKMYWGDSDLNSFNRANLNGSQVETLGIDRAYPNSIALDVSGGKIYWTDLYEIQQANLDGSQVETLISGLEEGILRGLALDVGGGKIYWTNWDSDRTGRIYRANLNGSQVETLVSIGEGPWSIALDVGGSKMYWTDRWGSKIYRANLDGSQVETLVHDGYPAGLALDVGGGKMYWTDWLRGRIYRANLDGSQVETLISGLDDPSGIALDIPRAGQR